MLPYARGHFGRNFVFQHDNAPSHRAHRLPDFLQDEEVEQLSWPPYSPDLNPNEHAWDAFNHAIHQREVQPTNLAELADALTQGWGALSQRYLNKLVKSVPRRIATAIQAGICQGYTRY